MPAYTTVAIVLRRLHYGETDNILTLYSAEQGRFSAIAKGARKAISRLSGATEVLTCTRFGLATGKSLEIVTQAEVQDSFSVMRQTLTRLAHGLYLADLTDHSVEDHLPNPILYDLLWRGLTLTQTVTPPSVVARWFELQLLRDLGYAPDLSECAVCQTPLPEGFPADEWFALSVLTGGLLCPRHAHPESNDDHSGLSYNAVVFLQILDGLGLDGDLGIELPGSRPQEQARMALRRFLRHRLERDLKSLEFLDSLRHLG